MSRQDLPLINPGHYPPSQTTLLLLEYQTREGSKGLLTRLRRFWDMEKVFKEHGFHRDGHIRLSDNSMWHNLTESEFCQCFPNSDQDNCEPVQTAFPLSLSKLLIFPVNKLPKENALDLGRSSQLPWVWDDSGDLREGQFGEPASDWYEDSGIGVSLTLSIPASQISAFSKSDIRFIGSPSDAHKNSTAPPVSGTVRHRYAKESYTVGIICTLPKELKVVWAFFDEMYDGLEDFKDNSYVFAKMGNNKVVARCLSTCGTHEAASVAVDMKYRFNLPFCLLFGVGVDVPLQDNDIRLSDVVAGEEVVQYGLGQRRGAFLK